MEKGEATVAPPAGSGVAATPVNVVAPVAESPPQAKRIEQAIRRASGGRIHKLRIEFTRGQVLLWGFCSSYYAKQLAQHAAMPLLEELQLVNKIEVW